MRLLPFWEFLLQSWQEVWMISQLSNPLWEEIFKHKNLDGYTRDDMLRLISLVWDRVDLSTNKLGAIGIFQLKGNAGFVLIKALYSKSRAIYENVVATYLLACAENEEAALLEFLPFLSKQDKEWLSPFISLKLRSHPAYHGQ